MTGPRYYSNVVDKLATKLLAIVCTAYFTVVNNLKSTQEAPLLVLLQIDSQVKNGKMCI